MTLPLSGHRIAIKILLTGKIEEGPAQSGSNHLEGQFHQAIVKADPLDLAQAPLT